MEHDVFVRHYQRVCRDPVIRARLVEDPKGELERHFGYMPAGDFRVEVVEQSPDTVTVLLPTPPEDRAPTGDELEAVTERVYDILFHTGVGGYLIPDPRLMWALRDMRSQWAARGRPEEG